MSTEDSAPATPPPGTVIDAGEMPGQKLLDGGLNYFACQLLSESFHTSGALRAFPDNPVAFSVDGVKITLERIAEPSHPRIREELGLPPNVPGTRVAKAKKTVQP